MSFKLIKKSNRLRTLLIMLLFTGANTSSIAQTDQVEDAIFQTIREQLETSVNQEIPFYAPQHYNRALEKYEAALEGFRAEVKLSTIKDRIQEASELLEQAADAAKVSKVVLDDLVRMRVQILESGYYRDASNEIEASEKRFRKAIQELEDGDLRRARSEIEQAFSQYRRATIKLLREKDIKKARNDIKDIRNNVDRAKYEQSQKDLEELNKIVGQLDKEEFNPVRKKDDIQIKIKDIVESLFPPFYQNLPDTLLIGEFTLIVDAYSDRGLWDFSDQQAVGLSGSAWTKFSCAESLMPLFPVITGGYTVVTPVFEATVEVTNPATQISIAEAQLIQPDIQVGQHVKLELAVADNNTMDIRQEKDEFIDKLKMKQVKPVYKGDVLLRFNSVTIKPVKGRINTGKIVKGTAAYPAKVKKPELIRLSVSGFTAEIDILTLTPAQAKANINLVFPNSIAAAGDYGRVSVKLGETALSPQCEFYVEKKSLPFKPFYVDALGILFKGTGLIADFNSSKSDSSHLVSLSPGWMGVVFKKGESISQDSYKSCNTGYLYGRYGFQNAIIASSGFNADLKLLQSWTFTSLAPGKFQVNLQTGLLNITDTAVTDGTYSGTVLLPADVKSPGGTKINATFKKLNIDKTQSLSGSVDIPDELRWGGFGLVSKKGNLRLKAGPREFVSPIKKDTLNTKLYTSAGFDTLSGLTIPSRSGDSLKVYASESKKTLFFQHDDGVLGYLHLHTGGVSGYFYSMEQRDWKAQLGDKKQKHYLANTAFSATFRHSLPDTLWMKFWFAGNAVFDSDMRGRFDIPYPSASTKAAFFEAPFKKMGVTSTASFAGGLVAFKDKKELGYWGVNMTARRGIISIKGGEIVYTDADIYEEVHYSKGFNILWGEMLADGNLGQFYFNHNCAGQKFDGIPVTLDTASLSKYRPKLKGDLQGALVVRGSVHFDFFGEPDTLLTITDTRYLKHAAKPHYGRLVTIDPYTFELDRKWGSDFVHMDFTTVGYDSVNQNGFSGYGNVTIVEFFSQTQLYATIRLDSISSSICVTKDTPQKLMMTTSLTELSSLWGCAYIEGDALKRMVFGGRSEGTFNPKVMTDIILPSAGTSIETKMIVTPTITSTMMEGLMYLSLGASINMESACKIKFTYDRSVPSVEADIQGKFTFDQTLSVSAEAEGQLNWHFGADYQLIQGRVKVNIFSIASGSGFSGGVFIGLNAPREKAWILYEGENGKNGIDIDNMPKRLSGVYVYGDLDLSLSAAGIISGGIELYVGVGVFLSDFGNNQCPLNLIPPLYVIGNVGGRIYGKVLWGAASVEGYANLQLAIGNPYYFEGTFGLKACVLWIFCANVNITAGMSTEKGFYLE